MFTRPSAVLDRRLILQDGRHISQVLVTWLGFSIEEALWVDETEFQLTYPDFLYKNKGLPVDLCNTIADSEMEVEFNEDKSGRTTETEEQEGDTESSDLNNSSDALENENDAARVFRSGAEEIPDRDEEGRKKRTEATERNEKGTRVMESAENPADIFIPNLEQSLGLGSPMGLEDKSILPQPGIDTAQLTAEPVIAVRPTRIKSAPTWTADFVT
ncbi:hypothetical protein OROGR_003574 [Orobanche gracilis]